MQYVKLKILQWNVWYKEDVKRVLGVLKKLNADVICLQELTHGYIKQTHESTWEYIGHQLGLAYSFQEIPIIRADDQWLQANAIFSRYPIENEMATWIHKPASNRKPGDQYRGYLETTLNIDGKRTIVGTTHMSFRPDPKNDRELNNLLSIIESRPRRYILTGDINATPDSRRISELMKRLNHAGPSFDQNTWTTKRFDFPEFKALTLDWRYDYIFTSRDIKVSDAAIIKTDISDHLPVMATVEL